MSTFYMMDGNTLWDCSTRYIQSECEAKGWVRQVARGDFDVSYKKDTAPSMSSGKVSPTVRQHALFLLYWQRSASLCHSKALYSCNQEGKARGTESIRLYPGFRNAVATAKKAPRPPDTTAWWSPAPRRSRWASSPSPPRSAATYSSRWTARPFPRCQFAVSSRILSRGRDFIKDILLSLLDLCFCSMKPT